MASNVAAPKNTGGGGFVFEDDVCAWLLACMLAGEPAFDAEHGAPSRVDFQTRVDGWFLDDALVTSNSGASQHRIALSVKSNAQFTASSAPTDFVEGAWEQWLHIGSTILDQAKDFMGLVTGRLSEAAEKSIGGLSRKVLAADPLTFATRLATPEWANGDERALFASFACPDKPVLGAPHSEVDTVQLLKRLRFRQHDFGDAASESLKLSLRLCRACVRSNTSEDAEVLWHLLRGIAAELRPVAGSITLRQLVERLRGRLGLAEYPDYVRDWAGLDARSNRDAALVSNCIGSSVRIGRDASVAELAKALSADELIVLLGASGIGKSAVARELFDRRIFGNEPTLWLDVRSLDCAGFEPFEATLRLQHPLGELLGASVAFNPVLILDGVDRLYSETAFRNVAILLQCARQEPPAGRWRVVIPCQSQEWPRVLEAIQRAGVIAGSWKQLQLEPMSVSDLEVVGDALPSLKRLLVQPKVSAILRNLKLLDLVARRVEAGIEVDSTKWVGETSVADWFWNAEIERGTDRIARGRFVRKLALLQADALVGSVLIDDLDPSELGALQSLVADRLCLQVPGDRIAFAHDLYGDWVRLRILSNLDNSDWQPFVAQHESPLWHRALRLLGIRLLEQEGGLDRWRALLASLNQGEDSVVFDVLLEAPVFSVNGYELLDAVYPDLVNQDGRLLRRLLTRFLVFATIPDEAMSARLREAGFDDDASIRARHRLPFWPHWVGVLMFLYARRATILGVAPNEVAHVVEMWLRCTPYETFLRREAAELAVRLGCIACDERENYRSSVDRKLLLTCALLAAKERPDEVAEISVMAAERGPRTNTREPPPKAPSTILETSIWGPPKLASEPWPDGPWTRVNEGLADALLEGSAIVVLFGTRPTAAREAVLATLIERKHETAAYEVRAGHRHLHCIDRHKWIPAFYTNGPFLQFLRENFNEGLEVVARLVEFATERACSEFESDLEQMRHQWIQEGHSEAEANEAIASASGWELRVDDGETTARAFAGDEYVFGWGWGVRNPPRSVLVALMALEQYFYECIDAGKSVRDEVSMVFQRTKTVALLGVLCDVGKRQQELFDGPLRCLLTSPEVHLWDITRRVQGRGHLLIGFWGKGEWFGRMAQAFHGQKHREADLRHVAVERMLRSAETRAYFDRIRKRWEGVELPSSRIFDMRQQLAMMLNSAHWELQEDPLRGTVLINRAAMDVWNAQANERAAIDDLALVVGFPSRCRKILDEESALGEEELTQFFNQWCRIRDLAASGPALPNGETRFGDEYPNAIAGGATVLLLHEAWLRDNETRSMAVIDAVCGMLTDPPSGSGFDTEDGISTWTWDCFLAEACACLWSRDVSNVVWRHAVADAVLSTKYTVIQRVFERCAKTRDRLDHDFSRLRRLALEWSYVRARVVLATRAPREVFQIGDSEYERLTQLPMAWREEKVEAFVLGTSPGMISDWSECNIDERFAELDAAAPMWRNERCMDFRVVRSAHEWMPRSFEALGSDERTTMMDFWHAALCTVLARPQADPERRGQQYPDDQERWVLERVAEVVLKLAGEEDCGRFWKPIVGLHSETHHWPDLFVSHLHRLALTSAEMPRSYVGLVRRIVEMALENGAQKKRRWHSHERVWDTLVGVDGWTHSLWEQQHAPVVAQLEDVFLLWMKNVPVDGRRMGGFARWLMCPPAARIRLAGIKWFHGLLFPEGKGKMVYGVEDSAESIGALLQFIWNNEEGRLRADQQAFGAFRALLGWLNARQNPLGLELVGRMGGLV